MSIEYSTALTPLARGLRSKQTPMEKIFWEVVRNRNVLGYKFVRQKPLAGYIADFYCERLKLFIEIDGGIHASRQAYDATRTRELNGMKITVIRYSNEEIQNKLPRVIAHLEKIICLLSKDSPSRRARLWRGTRGG